MASHSHHLTSGSSHQTGSSPPPPLLLQGAGDIVGVGVEQPIPDLLLVAKVLPGLSARRSNFCLAPKTPDLLLVAKVPPGLSGEEEQLLPGSEDP